jgi:hypothetical protein
MIPVAISSDDLETNSLYMMPPTIMHIPHINDTIIIPNALDIPQQRSDEIGGLLSFGGGKFVDLFDDLRSELLYILLLSSLSSSLKRSSDFLLLRVDLASAGGVGFGGCDGATTADGVVFCSS